MILNKEWTQNAVMYRKGDNLNMKIKDKTLKNFN